MLFWFKSQFTNPGFIERPKQLDFLVSFFPLICCIETNGISRSNIPLPRLPSDQNSPLKTLQHLQPVCWEIWPPLPMDKQLRWSKEPSLLHLFPILPCLHDNFGSDLHDYWTFRCLGHWNNRWGSSLLRAVTRWHGSHRLIHLQNDEHSGDKLDRILHPTSAFPFIHPS